MKKKLEDVLRLTQRHAKEISSSSESWADYLDTAAKLYRYNFHDSMLIHAQRPGASACATVPQWNRIQRRVNRGSSGIALIDETGERRKLRYVFDASDTHAAWNGVGPDLSDMMLHTWDLQPEDESTVADFLVDAYGIDEDVFGSLAATLHEVAWQQADENFEDSINGLYGVAAFLSAMDNADAMDSYHELIVSSIYYILLRRCGINPADVMGPNPFAGIEEYDSFDRLKFIGHPACEISEPVLRAIGQEVTQIAKEKSIKGVANKEERVYNTNRTPVLARRDRQIKEGGQEDEDHIPLGRRLQDSGSVLGAGSLRGDVRQVRADAQEVSAGESEDDLRRDAGEPGARQALQGDRRPGQPEDGRADGATGEEVHASGQSDRPTGLGSMDEQHQGDGGGERPDGDYLRVNQRAKEYTSLIGAMPPQEASGDEEAPGQEETELPEMTSGNGKPLASESEKNKERAEDANASALSLSENGIIPVGVVDEILQSGTNSENGKLRILYSYMIDGASMEELTAFVKDEYGVGGRGLVIDGQPYAVWHDADGMRIAKGNSVHRNEVNSYSFRWNEIAAWIGQLISEGRYASQVELDEAGNNAYQEAATGLEFMERDLAEGVADVTFADTSIFSGGFDEVHDRLSTQMKDPVFLSDLSSRLDGLAGAYEIDRRVMRFHGGRNTPDHVAEAVRRLLLPTHDLPSSSITLKEPQYFVTGDEVDELIVSRSSFANTQLVEYMEYCNGASQSWMAEIMREQYGNGGFSHALSRADDSFADFSGAGAVLSRGSFKFELHLSWGEMAHRALRLMREGQFLNEENRKRMPVFEKEQMARRASEFYYGFPEEKIICPFPADSFKQIFAGNHQTTPEQLVNEMRNAFAELPAGYASYGKREKLLSEIEGYLGGTFTIFPEPESIKPVIDILAESVSEKGTGSPAPNETAEAGTEKPVQSQPGRPENTNRRNRRRSASSDDSGQMSLFDLIQEEQEEQPAENRKEKPKEQAGESSEELSEKQGISKPVEANVPESGTPQAERSEETSTAEDKGIFEYHGYHFKPVGVVPENGDLPQGIDETGRDVKPLMADNDDADIPYNYGQFYRASGMMDVDIFLCIETGKNYYAGNHELIAYDGEYGPYPGVVVRSETTESPRESVADKESEAAGELETAGEPETSNEPEKNGDLEPKLKSIVLELNPDVPEPEHEPQEEHDPINYHITGNGQPQGGPKTRYRANVDAIRLLKELESENRLANPEEQEVLARYAGWGGIPQAFDADNAEWTDEFTELEGLLSPDEYRAARSSTLSAFYTPPSVVRAVYTALGRMGLASGNVLEPSCGVGNFMGGVPDGMDLNMYGVELDSITGRIAGQLYQKNTVLVQGFENTDFPDNLFDCVVGNVPFGSFSLPDKKYDRHKFLVHDYFIAKSIDLVRPGGVVAVVTTSGTLDKRDNYARRYFAERADLLGAIRLPDNAFSSAGTSVVSDILFFQKRDRAALEMPYWVDSVETEDGISTSSYFAAHPTMVLGETSTVINRFGEKVLTVKAKPDIDLDSLLRDAVSRINGEITSADPETDVTDVGEEHILAADPSVRNFSYTEIDGQVYFRENSRMILQHLPKTTTERVRGMISLRETVRELLDAQLTEGKDDEITRLQGELNDSYDRYTSKYGLISSTANRLAFRADSSYSLLSALEVLDESGKLQRKADIFTKRTVRHAAPVNHVDTASEALALSIGEIACVDLAYMSGLCEKTEDEITKELSGVIFKNPQTKVWETSDEYLSGNVREKLSIARAAAREDPLYAVNVAHLEQVQPKDLDASEIEVRLGATWIDAKYVDQFMRETFNTPYFRAIDVIYTETSGQWTVTGQSSDYGNPLVDSVYGTRRANAYRLLEDALNLKDTKIYDTVHDDDGKEKRVLNKKETTLAQQKQESIKDKFREWIFADVYRREDLCKTYNELYNSTRPRDYDGSHLRLEGMSEEITLMQHQKDAIARMLYGGNTMLAHCVGAGKTFQMIAAGMESRRLGLANKCLYVVPNHLTEQWGADFMRLYPAANILVATKKDFEPANRKRFCSRIATGDYDAIIIGHSQFERIPLSKERQAASIQKQIDEITESVAALKNDSGARITVKQMENTRKTLEAKLMRLNDQKRKDDVVTFEQLGVDRLFVDESHNYKNLYIYTKMRNVAGISQTDAQKSSDMYAKCQYLDEKTGGKGIVFATGTPISNSMVELYTVMRYLQGDTLRKLGLSHFDSWAANFGETVTAIELAPEGTGYRAKTRFARFFNLPELISIFKESADIRTADMLNLPTPVAEYINEVIAPSDIQKSTVASFSRRADDVRNNSVNPRDDNMLKITNDGRKLALDQRLMDPLLPDEPDSKVNRCVKNVFSIWRDTAEQRLTQLVFCDLSTPKGDGSFNVYDDVRDKLVGMGVPREEVAFIHEANTETRKAELFSKVRNGQVRILLGPTQKMGAGTNVQDKLVALHHLDCPWKPSDLEQQEGRILRQGNQNAKVQIYRYVTEGTFDAYSWQLLENKQKFISQIMTSKSPVRSAEDVDDAALSYAEIKALATGNPYIKEKMDLDVQVSKLRLLKANHTSQIYKLQSDIAHVYPEKITAAKERLAGLKTDAQAALPLIEAGRKDFKIEIAGIEYTDIKEAGEAIIAARPPAEGTGEKSHIGSYGKFDLRMGYDFWNKAYVLDIHGECSHNINLGRSAEGNITRVLNAVEGMKNEIPDVEDRLSNLESQFKSAKENVDVPFAQEEELAEKTARLSELNAMLNMDEKGTPSDCIGADEETVDNGHTVQQNQPSNRRPRV